jgi:hypothetical protein
MIRIGLVAAIAVTLAAPLSAQQVNPAATTRHASWNRGVVHYGKWVSAAMAVTFIGLGAHEYAKSDDAFSELLAICRADAAQCALNPGGNYANPTSEDLYQTSLHHERRARVRLLAGQASLLLAAGLFLADHGRRGSEPGNIPYHLTVEARAGEALVGVRVRF